MLYNHALAILGLRSWVSGLSAQVSVLGGSQVSSFQFPVLDLGFRGSSVGRRSQVSGLGVRGSGFGLRGSGLGISGIRSQGPGLRSRFWVTGLRKAQAVSPVSGWFKSGVSSNVNGVKRMQVLRDSNCALVKPDSMGLCFRMWWIAPYATELVQYFGPSPEKLGVTEQGAAYAESVDGVHWERSAEIVKLMTEGTVTRDGKEPDPSRRYADSIFCMLVLELTLNN